MLRNKFYVYGPENLPVPAHLHFGKEVLSRMVEYGDQPALINSDNGETMTFREFSQKTVDIALSLARAGFRKGDVATVCSDKRMEVMPTILGVICAGGVYTPTDISYGAVPLLHRVKISKPKVAFMSSEAYNLHKQTFDSANCVETYIVYDDNIQDGGKNDAILFKDFLTETADVKDFIPTPVDGWKDDVYILYSSGTTGLPKGVPWTHLATLINSESCVNESFSNSSVLTTREWCYTYGLFMTVSFLKKGATCIFSLKNEEEDNLKAIEKYRVKILQLTPSTIVEMSKSAILERYDVTSVEQIISSSTPVMKDQVEGIKKRLPNLRGVFQIYGTSEAGNVCNEFHAPLGPKHGSVGTPSHGFVLKVVDINTRETMGPNQRGEIYIKSPCITRGFLGMNNANHLDSEGFYRSGDVGYYDDDNYFFVVNRVKELIKYKDTSIAPAELEAILMRDSRVREAGVSAEGGEVAALVVLQPHASVTPEEILDYLHSSITFRMRLEGGVHFVESLPRGAGDKLDRRALHEMLLTKLNISKF